MPSTRRSTRAATKVKGPTPATTEATPKKRAPAKAPPSSSPKKTKRTGLKKAVTDTDQALGLVDPESKIQGGTIATLDNEPCDVMLVFIDPSANTDKFFILQLIRTSSKWIVYTRWGRTGTAGQALQVRRTTHLNFTSVGFPCLKNKLTFSRTL